MKHKDRWYAYYDVNLQTILIKTGQVWHHYRHYSTTRRHLRIPRTQHVVDFTKPSQLTNLQPLDIIRSDIHEYYVNKMEPVHNSVHNPSIPHTWTEYLTHLTT